MTPAIEAALRGPDGTEALKASTSIEFQNEGLDSLDGIEQLTRLRRVDCSTPHGFCGTGVEWNSISNLAPLAKLAMLEELELSEVPATDFTPLGSCSRLERLGLSETGIRDLQPLASCRFLHTLDIRGCKDLDATTIHQLSSLSTLYVSNEFDLGQLASLPHLRELNISTLYESNHSIDLRKLQALGQLTTLRIDRLRLEHPEALMALGHLQILSLKYCGLRDTSPLRALPELRSVDLRENPLVSLEGLRGLSHLEALAIGGVSFSTDNAYSEKQWKTDGYQTEWGQRAPDLAPLGTLSALKTLIAPEDPKADWPILPAIEEVAVLPMIVNRESTWRPASPPGVHPLRSVAGRHFTIRKLKYDDEPLNHTFPSIGCWEWVIFPNYGSTW